MDDVDSDSVILPKRLEVCNEIKYSYCSKLM